MAAVDDGQLARLGRILTIATALLAVVALASVALVVMVASRRPSREARAEQAAKQACQRWTGFTRSAGYSGLADTAPHQQALQGAARTVVASAAKAARLDGAGWQRLFEDAANVVSTSSKLNDPHAPTFVARDQGNLVSAELDLARECSKF